MPVGRRRVAAALVPVRRRWVAAALVLASACARPGDPGVVMDKVAADVAFGAPTPVPAPSPAPTLSVVLPPPLETAEPPRPVRLPSVTFRPPPASICPEAGPTDVPDVEAPIRVSGRPQEGSYRWIFDGTQVVGGVRVPLPALAQRDVLDVARDALGTLTFRTREEDPALDASGPVTTSYRADADGVHLTRTERGGRTFAPVAPVLLLPVPVTRGETFQSSGVDPASLQVMQLSGTVAGRARVDACGRLVEGWLVAGELTVTASGQATERRAYSYVVATHLGGLLVFEHLERPCATSGPSRCEPPGTLRYDARIGQYPRPGDEP